MQKDQLDIYLKSNLRLLIYPHSKEAKCFEEADAVAYGESRWQLQEGREYGYEFLDDSDTPAKAFFYDKPGIVIPLRGKNKGTIKTGIYVGTMPLKIFDELSNRDINLSLEIQSIKTGYRDDYRKMLTDISEFYTDLVMMQGSPVTQKFEVDNDSEPNSLYQKFAFVKSIVDSETFEEAMHKIMLNPVRSWTETTVPRHIENVKRLGRSGLRQIVSRTDRIQSDVVSGFNSLPRAIDVKYKCDTTDNSENQFVKYVLTQFYGFCTDIASKPKASSQLKNEANIICNILLQYIGSSFFKDISRVQHLNLNSPVLQRKEGYREVLQGWLMFDLAAKLNWSGGDNVYDAGKRNVAALYEYWLFFKLLDIISGIFKVKPEDKENLISKDKDQLNLEIKQGRMKMISGVDDSSRKLNVRFYYNRTFGHKEDMHSAGSWTMPMRPDYTLSMWPGDISEAKAEQEELIVHIHFDAKYRINKILIENEDSKDVDDEESPLNQELTEEKEREESGDYEIGMYKRADLLKMHAYKDAIRRTSGAYILYPGTERSRKEGFHEIIPGLGAFCISPGKENDQVAALTKFILEVKRHMLDRATQREKMAYQTYKIYKDVPKTHVIEDLPESVGENRDFMLDETWVMLGYVKNDKHLEWIRKTGLYSFRTGTQNGSVKLSSNMVSSRYILLHSQGKSIEFVRLSSDGPRIFRRSDLLKMGYPPSEDEEKKKDDIYIVYRLESNKTESEWSQYGWKIKDLTDKTGHKMAEPDCVRLTEMMKKAKRE